MNANDVLGGLVEKIKKHQFCCDSHNSDGTVMEWGVVCPECRQRGEHMDGCNVLAAVNALPLLLGLSAAVRAYIDADPMVKGEAYRDMVSALARLDEGVRL